MLRRPWRRGCVPIGAAFVPAIRIAAGNRARWGSGQRRDLEERSTALLADDRVIESVAGSTRRCAGAEIDLVIERGAKRFAVEVKSGRADKPLAIRSLEAAATDIAASASTLIDQDRGRDPVRPRIERRGFEEVLRWLPA